MQSKSIRVDQIMGIGQKYATMLKNQNIHTMLDLLSIVPSKYEYFEIADYHNLPNDSKATVLGRVATASLTYRIRNKLSMLSFKANIQGVLVKITIFNRDFLKKMLLPGRMIQITGKVNKLKNEIIASEIFFDKMTSHYRVYYPIKDFSSKMLQGFIRNALNLKVELPQEYLPSKIIQHYRFAQYPELFEMMHFPTTNEQVEAVKNRFKYEEILSFFIKLHYFRQLKQKRYRNAKQYDIAKIKSFIQTIPFELTIDQKKTCNEIFSDLKGPVAMNRLVQGDVGSGKTIVAVLAAYACVTAQEQVVIMVPTEILAQQHAVYFSNMLQMLKVKIELFTASVKGKKREYLLESVSNGSTQILIGTHALLYETIQFKNLGLVIIDEQHRFGVSARNKLVEQKKHVDALYLTATPIPRSLLLTVFSDLDVSTVKSVRSTKLPLITKVYHTDELEHVFENFENLLQKNQQGYVVVPFIDTEEEEFTIPNTFELLQTRFPTFKTGILHGQLKQKEKDDVMHAFLEHKIDILLATTVIEVGISVDNANMMVILGAERFGLSQLHQLRGRVGRGTEQGYCYIVSHKDETPRLEELKHSNDGFHLSEVDLKLRGPGDFFGMRQSGIPEFVFANFAEDYELFKRIMKESERIYQDAFRPDHIEETSYVRRILRSLTEIHSLN